MMRPTHHRIIASLLIGCIVVSCHKKKEEKSLRQFEKQTMLRAPNDVTLPSKLWDLVAQGVGNEQTDFAPVRVTLIEKTHGTLGGHNHEIIFGQGGGEIDLKDYVVGGGTFWFSAEILQKPTEAEGEKAEGKDGAKKEEKKEPEKKEPEKKEEGKKEAAPSGPAFKIFYLSQGRERTVDRLKYGSGCHTYSEITSYFSKASKKEGLLGIVSGQRYVSTLSGVYFLSQREGDRLQLAQVTVKDSRYPALICPPHSGEELHK